jgi:choline dehydrogenase-like flavoprotein
MVTYETDVLVAGGGLGGIAAALASARAGAKTILVERNTYPGGVATAGMCCSIFNCYFTRQRELAIRGIPLEIADLLAEAGGPGANWRRHKGHIIYDIERAKLFLADILEREGITVLYETMITSALREGNRVAGTEIINKHGPGEIRAKITVDSTGDADVAALAGVPLRYVEKQNTNYSYVFRLGNVDLDKFINYFKKNPDQYPGMMDIEWTFDEALAQYNENGTFLFPHGGGMQLEIVKKGVESGELKREIGMYDTLDAMQMHGIKSIGVVHVITGIVKVDNLDTGMLSRAVTDGKRAAYHVADFYRRRLPGFENCYINGLADNLGIRTSRYIDGEFTFTRAMKSSPSRFPDVIGQGVVEKHPVLHKGERAWGCQVFGDDVYQIPYRCLLPGKSDGLIMGAGRSVSAENPSLLRVMAVTMVVGQGAGTAAAICARKGWEPRRADPAAVQGELARQGVVLEGVKL